MGRIKAESVIECEPNKRQIQKALERAFSSTFKNLIRNTLNPYEKENKAVTIKEIIKTSNLDGVLRKSFHDLQFPSALQSFQ